jgi:hypothetical protein
MRGDASNYRDMSDTMSLLIQPDMFLARKLTLLCFHWLGAQDW